MDIAKSLTLGTLICWALTACVSTDFLRYEGRKDLVFEGQGGARTTIDGIDFWEQGEPPRKYQLLGYIKDERGTGLIYRLKKNGDVAAKAKAVGGDAVMALSASTTLTGTIVNAVGGSTTTYGRTSSTTSGYGTTVSVPVGRPKEAMPFSSILIEACPTPAQHAPP